jgi:hypothetical protein
MPNTDEQVISILRNAPVMDTDRDAMWTAYKSAASREEFRRQFDTMPVPKEIKRQLWFAKFPEAASAPKPVPVEPPPPPKATVRPISDATKQAPKPPNPALVALDNAEMPQVTPEKIAPAEPPKPGVMDTIRSVASNYWDVAKESASRAAETISTGLQNTEVAERAYGTPFHGPTEEERGEVQAANERTAQVAARPVVPLSRLAPENPKGVVQNFAAGALTRAEQFTTPPDLIAGVLAAIAAPAAPTAALVLGRVGAGAMAVGATPKLVEGVKLAKEGKADEAARVFGEAGVDIAPALITETLIRLPKGAPRPTSKAKKGNPAVAYRPLRKDPLQIEAPPLQLEAPPQPPREMVPVRPQEPPVPPVAAEGPVITDVIASRAVIEAGEAPTPANIQAYKQAMEAADPADFLTPESYAEFFGGARVSAETKSPDALTEASGQPGIPSPKSIVAEEPPRPISDIAEPPVPPQAGSGTAVADGDRGVPSVQVEQTPPLSAQEGGSPVPSPERSSKALHAEVETSPDGRGKLRYFDGDGNLIGTASTYKNHALTVIVMPEHQRKGYGSQILSDLVDRGMQTADAATPEGEGLLKANGWSLRDGEYRAPSPEPPAPPSVDADQGAVAKAALVKRARVETVPTKSLKRDPVRFQYKTNVGKGGVSDKMKDDDVAWNHDLAGVLAVWDDPVDGETYVVNGHHRHEKAERQDVPDVDIRRIDAKDAREARAIGALINIAEGQGTSLDAAKVFRDLDFDDAALKKRGIHLKGSLAKEAAALRDLTPEVFTKVVNEEIAPDTAAIIGRMLKSPEDQIAAVELLGRATAQGKKLTSGEVTDLIKFAQDAPKKEVVDDNFNLFGNDVTVQNTAVDKARLSDAIRGQLKQEKRLFSTVGKESAAAKLAEAGNTIKAKDNAAIAEEANRALEVYNKLYTSAGPISTALNDGAIRLARGDSESAVRKDTYEAIRRAIAEVFQGGDRKDTGRSAVDLPGRSSEAGPGSNPVRPEQPAGTAEVAEPPQPSLLGAEPPKPPSGDQPLLGGDLFQQEVASFNDSRSAAKLKAQMEAELGSQVYRGDPSAMIERDSPLFGGKPIDDSPEQGSLISDVDPPIPPKSGGAAVEPPKPQPKPAEPPKPPAPKAAKPAKPKAEPTPQEQLAQVRADIEKWKAKSYQTSDRSVYVKSSQDVGNVTAINEGRRRKKIAELEAKAAELEALTGAPKFLRSMESDKPVSEMPPAEIAASIKYKLVAEPDAPAKTKASRLYVNAPAKMVIRAALKAGGSDYGNFKGLMLYPVNILKAADAMRAKKVPGLTDEQMKPIRELGEALAQLYQTSRAGVIIDAETGKTIAEIKEAVRHEQTHVASEFASQGSPLFDYKQDGDPEFQRLAKTAMDNLKEIGYPSDNDTLYRETISHIASGDFRVTNGSIEDAAKLLAGILERIEKTHGKKAAAKVITNAKPGIKQAVGAVRVRTGLSGEPPKPPKTD